MSSILDRPLTAAPARRAEPDLPVRLSSPVLVGRERELEQIVGTVAERPALVVVEGEAGVGKTRLIRECLQAPQLAELRVLAGSCQPLREPFPLGPLLEAVRAAGALPAARLSPVAGALQPLLPELAEWLPPAPGPLHDARSERHRVFRALAELLAALGPAVCVLEDLHWADEATLEFLRFLLAQPPDGLALLCSYRREELPAGASLLPVTGRLDAPVRQRRVVLDPLSAADVGRLIAAILDAEEVSEEFARYLHHRASGLPFAVEEILGLLQERRDVVRRDGRWARSALDKLALPEAVRDSILERVERLSPQARLVVQAAAVVGEGDDELLLAVAGLPPVPGREALGDALRAGFLAEGDDARCRFRHLLARQAVYEQIPGPQRRALHLAAACALEQEPPPLPVAHLAHHYRHAQRPEQWARYAELAADTAASLHDEVSVCRFLQDALAAPGLDRDDRVRLAVKLGNAAMHSLDHHEAATVIRNLLEVEPLEAADRGALRRSLGVLLVQAGDASAGVVELRRAVPDLTDRPMIAVRAMMSLAVPWVVEGHVEEHLAWLQRATEALRPDAQPVDRLAFLVDRATALLFLARPEAWAAADELPRDVATVAEARESLRGCLNLAQGALWLGHYRRAEELLARFATLGDESASVRLEGMVQTTRVLLDHKMGRWEGLEERARALCETMAAVPHACADVQGVLGCLLLARGEAEEAAALLEPLLEVARRSGSVPVLAMASAALARLELARDEPQAALDRVEPVVAILAAKGTWGWADEVVQVAVEALALLDRTDEAAALTERFSVGLAGLDAPASDAALQVCHAHLAIATAAEDDASTYAAAAAQQWAALPDPYEAARAAELRVTAAGIDENTAPEAFDDVLAAYEALGAEWEIARVRHRLRNAGVTLTYRWRGGRRGYGNDLSPREEEVVAMVAEGLTNREIAVRLFLSPRTVEFHVAKAMRKLGAANRKELASLLAEPAQAQNP